MYNKLNPPETIINYDCNQKFNHIEINNNGYVYNRILNPYEKMVNNAMIDNINGGNKISFKSKAFYDKCTELSLTPAIAKMDNRNPIFYYIANPIDYRFYQIDNYY
jgi:hypothetical protein